MVSITLSLPVAIVIAVGGGIWIYKDATERGMSTADM